MASPGKRSVGGSAAIRWPRLPRVLFLLALFSAAVVAVVTAWVLANRHPKGLSLCPTREAILSGKEGCKATPALMLSGLLRAIDDLHARFEPIEATDAEGGPQSASVAVLYAISDTLGSPALSDTAAINFLHFAHHVVREYHPAVRLFVIVSGTVRPELTRAIVALRRLPFVGVYRRANFGFDACALHEQLSVLEARRQRYDYYVVLNSSVRGPFLPGYLAHKPWFEVFTDRISETTKLVGPFANCDRAPHIQSFAYATDASGLDIIRPSFVCRDSREETIDEYEVAMSRRIIKAGFAISSFLSPYRSIDFSSSSVQNCNGGNNPTVKKSYFGFSVSLHESLFWKSGGDIERRGLVDPAVAAEAEFLTCFDVCIDRQPAARTLVTT